MKKIFAMFVLSLIIFNVSVFGYMFANGSGKPWPTPIGDDTSFNGASLDQLIMEGASSFICSLSEYQKYLYLFEQNEGQSIASISNAYTKISIAYMNFNQAYKQTSGKPCNPQTVEALRIFDYEGYKKVNGCVPYIFDEVSRYLKRCMISEWYQSISQKMGNILIDIKAIKSILERGGTPDLNLLWRLNQKYFEVSLEGQYIAEVFKKI